MTATGPLRAEFIGSLAEIDPQQWDAVADIRYPFLRHQFLYGLETSGCTTAETGWQPCHLLLYRDDDLLALMPLYLKSHSYGEYVFDWSWADAWQRSGLAYYPKLVTAIPFTPATGPRLCSAGAAASQQLWLEALAAVRQFAQQRGISSWHLLFPDTDVADSLAQHELPVRHATQFHWFNQNYRSFDDFLARFNSRKRKAVRRERRRVAEQGLRLQVLEGEQISPRHWSQFHHFYQLTYAKRSGHGGYLTGEFFTEVAAAMAEQAVMVVAELAGQDVAAALYFRSDDTLYGRYWGCVQEFDCLHFEACYYQGIEYCIAHGLQRFDPGAQGEHKIQRGFEPVTTYSNHWIAHPQLADAVADFVGREREHIAAYADNAFEYLPFKDS